jgi:hypothetical protein
MFFGIGQSIHATDDPTLHGVVFDIFEMPGRSSRAQPAFF